ncbi:MAG: HD domain-containing protein [Bacteriovoracaceae bacterium]|nr:HD domain-containing protein [Bacteriovoracaceae bacterium]
MGLPKNKDKANFFSVAFDLISTEKSLSYELYVNASNQEGREHFVRIYPMNEALSDNEVEEFRDKYRTVYVLEEHRSIYLKSLTTNEKFTDERKTDVIKDSAIKHLTTLFDDTRELNTDILMETIENCRETVSAMVDVIEDYSVNQLRELIGNLSFHDFYTYDHSVNVSLYCVILLKQVKPDVSKEEMTLIGMGGLLHDLGKVEVPTSIINNTGKLSDEQFAVIKKHPGAGVRILMEKLADYPKKEDISTIMRVVGEHHENEDGTGYPKGLAGNDIHFYARICAVADFFDAITTKRSYSEVVTPNEAVTIMERSVGKKLNRQIFDAFSRDVVRIYGKKAATRDLPENFEPSVPHNVLPFTALKAQKLNYNILGDGEKKNDYGSVKKK